MDLERTVEIFVAINLFVIGASHLLQPRVWIDFFKILSGYGKAGAYVNGFLCLSFGSIIVAFHWVWEGAIPTLVTLLGLAQLLKSFVAFVMPSVSLRSMSAPMAVKPIGYQLGGVLFLILAVLLFVHLLE
jgi:hypothetical protein